MHSSLIIAFICLFGLLCVCECLAADLLGNHSQELAKVILHGWEGYFG